MQIIRLRFCTTFDNKFELQNVDDWWLIITGNIEHSDTFRRKNCAQYSIQNSNTNKFILLNIWILIFRSFNSSLLCTLFNSWTEF